MSVENRSGALSGRHVLVTGATGFVGRRIGAAIVHQGGRVTAWSRNPPVEAVRGWTWETVDLGRREALDRLVAAAPSLDAVVHCAGVAHARPGPEVLARLRAVTVEGTARLLAACAAAGIGRVLMLSSVKAQGTPPAGTVGTPKSPRRPEGPYGEAKAQAEDLLESWVAEGGRQGAVLRLPLVYGAGARGNLASLARMARRGWAVTVGPGMAQRSLVGVDNVADAVVGLLAAPGPEGFEIYLPTDGEPYAVAELVETLGAAAGRRVRRLRLPLMPLRWGARIGDLAERLVGRPLPLSSAVLSRLTEDAIYRCDALEAACGWTPRQRFADAAPGMVSAAGASDGRASSTTEGRR